MGDQMAEPISTTSLRTDDDQPNPLETEQLEDGLALAVSGGGFKAAAFHLGGFIRLNELGQLKKLARISSVSGGSIASGYLAHQWAAFTFNAQGVATNFGDAFAQPFAKFLTSASIDVGAIIEGVLLPGMTAADHLINAYKEDLFGQATLQDLPDETAAPQFVFNATNFELNSLWRFRKAYAADYRVGQIRQPTFLLAQVVAASSGFPPFFSPIELKLDGIEPLDGADRNVAPYNQRALVMDGGVYDNMGMEAVWKRYRTLLISNAGNAVDEHPSPREDWVHQLLRTVSMIHRQAENNRVRWLLALARSGERTVAYWPLRGRVGTFNVPGSIALSEPDALAATLAPVRLSKLDTPLLAKLANHGYSLTDAAVRRWLGTPNQPPPVFPQLGGCCQVKAIIRPAGEICAL